MKDILFFLKQIHSYSGNVLYVNLAAMIVIGLLEGAAILLLIPMISLSGIIDINIEGIPLIGLFSFLRDIPPSIGLPLVLGVFVLLAAGQNLMHRTVTIRNATIQHGFLRHLRMETYRNLLFSNWSFFIQKRKSDIINILTTEISKANGGTHSVLQFMSSIITTAIQVGLAFLLAPSITIFVMLCGLVLIYFNRRFLKRSLALGKRNFLLTKEYIGGITDQMNGIKDIKSNTLEHSRMDWYTGITKGMQNEQIEYLKLKTTSQLYYKMASAVLIAVFVYLSIRLFNAQAAQLGLIVIIFSRLWPRVAGIQASLEQIATVLPSFKAVKALQHECKGAQEFSLHQNDAEPISFAHQIECRNVFFRYNQQEPKNTLENINLVLPSFKMTAFVGRSGAGKSTLIDLIMGLNKPESGQLLIDGVELTKDNLLSLRQAISYVPQDPFLFNTTIRENLLLVKPDASDEDLWEALSFACADQFVKRLPNKLDTLIGDRGIKLSGGERQRLVIARAILRKPSILVLDEATSALDSESEARIQEALERLKGKMTILVIAHRLSTIRNSDQVVVLEDGKVIQQGGFNQLSQEKSKVFSHLLKRQMEVAP
ncbi:ABC transporter ATP-binding protein [Jeotgalibacillus sp. ET6]|uniref:ABC transporter ATP-binding protein n=1 Tax=Jeotgalibacillus sp. ET6 TaxID=3037260 RepID=UPI00241855EB|nr:ABC transporter ATP-binding protein [Jeotgalibacillus sp. ET6]MDG5472624.1 ABC transporter ATP-binding protein [Jeotgalibacillus sp. ET6]